MSAIERVTAILIKDCLVLIWKNDIRSMDRGEEIFRIDIDTVRTRVNTVNEILSESRQQLKYNQTSLQTDCASSSTSARSCSLMSKAPSFCAGEATA